MFLRQVERHKRTAEGAKEALAAREAQLKENSRDGAKAEKDRWGGGGRPHLRSPEPRALSEPLSALTRFAARVHVVV